MPGTHPQGNTKKRLFLSRACDVQIDSSDCRLLSLQMFCCRKLMFVQGSEVRVPQRQERDSGHSVPTNHICRELRAKSWARLVREGSTLPSTEL